MFCFVAMLAGAQESFTGVQVDAGKVVKQQLYEDSTEACGPASMINVLRFGTPELQKVFNALVGNDDRMRLRYVIDRYFKNKNSVVFPRAKRFGHTGVMAKDLENAFNDLLKENNLESVSRLELNRQAGEADREFLQRVYGKLQRSLENGVPPIIQLRSYAVMPEQEGSVNMEWRAMNNHYVVVTRVPKELRKQDMGFTFDAIDSNGGRLVSGYVFGEKHLPFRAEKGTTDPARVEWLSGRPFLLVKAPGVVSLQPRKAKWKHRVIVTLSEVIGSF
ncbi:MAG: hypothetical protein GXP30_01890 [Verrucomicrobia bacterium]|nr:hypothetical protein [Verrucomicrobiota bacterium]